MTSQTVVAGCVVGLRRLCDAFLGCVAATTALGYCAPDLGLAPLLMLRLCVHVCVASTMMLAVTSAAVAGKWPLCGQVTCCWHAVTTLTQTHTHTHSSVECGMPLATCSSLMQSCLCGKFSAASAIVDCKYFFISLSVFRCHNRSCDLCNLLSVISNRQFAILFVLKRLRLFSVCVCLLLVQRHRV